MPESYKKKGKDLEVTKTIVSSITEGELLQEREDLQEERRHRLQDIVSMQKDVAEIDAKLAIAVDKLCTIRKEPDHVRE